MPSEDRSTKCLLRGMNHKPLTREDELVFLQKTLKGDSAARERLVESNQRFIVRVAISFRNQGISIADLIQEGNLGLIESIDRFDLSKKCRLISYGAWWIRLFMQRAIEQRSRTVTIPINKVCTLKKIRNYEYTFAKKHGRNPRIDEIADQLDMAVAKVEQIIHIGTSTVSLQAKDEEQDQALEEQLKVDMTESITHQIWVGELSKQINRALNNLTKREKSVLRCRFGLDNKEPASLRQAGKRLGLSAEGVRQIQVQAINKLKDPEFSASLQAFA